MTPPHQDILLQIEALREVAGKATEGKWSIDAKRGTIMTVDYPANPEAPRCCVACGLATGSLSGHANAAAIVALHNDSPAVLESAQNEILRLRGLVEKLSDPGQVVFDDRELYRDGYGAAWRRVRTIIAEAGGVTP